MSQDHLNVYKLCYICITHWIGEQSWCNFSNHKINSILFVSVPALTNLRD